MINQNIPVKEFSLQKTYETNIGQGRNKTYETNIGQANTYETNTNINNNNHMGDIPYGEIPPDEAVSRCYDCLGLRQIIHIDPEPVYNFYNATLKWQKDRIDTKLDEYRLLLVDFLLDKLQYQAGRLYQIAHDDFITKAGQIAIFGSGGKKKELGLMIIQNHPNPPYNFDIQGSNITQKVSLVTLNFEIKTLIKLKDAETLVAKRYEGVDLTDPKQVDITPINLQSLKSYIKANDNLSYRNEKVDEYNNHASEILLVSEYLDGVLPQIIVESDFGRRYYKGLNLQNVSKVVRNAALGDNYEYDLNSAVYAIKLNYASEITDKKFTYTSEYIEGGGKYKDSIRKMLALHCFDIDKNSKYFDERVKIIKHAITAIGFGAKKTSTGYFDKTTNQIKYTALSDIFTYTVKGDDGKDIKIPLKKKIDGKDVLCIDLFLQHKWMSEFIKEQDEMTKLIVHSCIENKIVTKETHPFLVDGRNAINTNRTIAYFFQSSERIIMDKICEQIEKDGIKVLLRVHDAFHTSKPINMKEIHSFIIEEFISSGIKWLGTKIISLEETFNQGYYYDDNDESDIDAAWSKLTGVKQSTSPVKIYHKSTKKTTEGFYDGSCDYGQTEYDPENDPYVQDMTDSERKEHYRILGHNPNQLPSFIKDTL